MKKFIAVFIILLSITTAYRTIPLRNTVPKEYGNYVRDYHYEIVNENGLVVRVFRDVVYLDRGEFLQEGTDNGGKWLWEPYVIVLSIENDSEIPLVNYHATVSCPEYGRFYSNVGGLREPVELVVDSPIRYDQNLTIELSFWELDSPKSSLTAYHTFTIPMINQYRYHDATIVAMQIGIKAIWVIGIAYCVYDEMLRKG